jgi:catalase
METAPGLYERIVDVFNAIYGAHEGHRAVHAKGTLCAGTFTATPDAAKLTKAAHMQGDPVRAHVRFSNASGIPTKPDGSRDSRGMATKFYLDDGTTTDVVAVTVPVFVARTPEDFLELTSARIPDPATGEPDPKKIEVYLEKHPEAMGSIFAAMSAQPPASYVQLSYHGVHAFRFENAAGETRSIRYRWEPEAGEAFLDPAEAKQRALDYLDADLEQRFAMGGGAFRLWAQIAEDTDDVNDPTAAWPDERERVELGRLEVTAFASDREQGDDVLVFDPTRVIAGIGLSDDRILHARPHAYAESVFRRSGVRRD